MNALPATTNGRLTMTSREIAELTGKEHKNVIRDIEKMLAELEKDALKFERIYLDSMNREKVEYHLPKDLTLTLVSGYSIKMRHRIITRWQELESTVTVIANRESSFDKLKDIAIRQAIDRDVTVGGVPCLGVTVGQI